MSMEQGNVQLEAKREKKNWNFLMRFKNRDDSLLSGSSNFFFIGMVIDKRQTSIHKRVSMNSYPNWKKCTNFISFSPAPLWFLTQHQTLLLILLMTTCRKAPPRERTDWGDVGSRRTQHRLYAKHTISLEPGQRRRKAWASSSVWLTTCYQSKVGQIT